MCKCWSPVFKRRFVTQLNSAFLQPGLDQLSSEPTLRCHFPTLCCTSKGQRGQLLSNSLKGKIQPCNCPSWIQAGEFGALRHSVPLLGCLCSQRNLRRVLFKDISHLLDQTTKTRSHFQAYHLKKVTPFSHAHHESQVVRLRLPIFTYNSVF